MIQAVLVSVALAALAPLAMASTAGDVSPSAGPTYQSLAAAGSDLLCGIRADDTIACWGSARFSVADHPDGEFRGISASRRAACGIRTDQTMDCWGRWYSDVDHTSGVEAPGGTFTKVDLAEEQACAIGTDGQIACFGHYARPNDAAARPVEGTFIDVATIHDDIGGCAIRTDGRIACWGDDTWGQASPPPGAFTDIAAGRMTVCAIDAGGELQCWGRGLYGAAEAPDGRYTSLAIGGDTGCAIRAEDGLLACWGADLGRPPDVAAAAVAIGDNIAGMIGTNGVLHTWGETRLWHVWGGWDEAERRDGFGAFRITGSVPATLETGVPVDISLGTTEIDPVPRFRVVSGALPPGITLAADGRLSGTPENAGTSGPIVIVADNGKAPMASTTIELVVAST
jgi:hypothetical protein